MKGRIHSLEPKGEIIYITRGVSPGPDNVNFCQPVIIRNQIYGQFNFIFILPHQKNIDQNDQKVERPQID